MERLTGKANKLPQYVAALSVCLGSVAAGFVLGWTSNISEELKKGDLNDIKMNDDDLGWIGSFSTLGALAICIPIGFICDWIGRKMAMLLLVIPFTIGWLLIILSTNVGMIYAGRFITGIAGGAFCISAPMYTSEIAEKEIRGILGTFFQLLLTVGIFLAYLISYLADILTYTIICGVVPLVFLVVFFFQPETPVYLAKKGDEAGAKASLRRLRGPHYNIDAEYDEIKAQLDTDLRSKVNFVAAIKQKAAIRACIICFGLMFFQQLSGINAVIFYTSRIFESAGSSLGAKEASLIVGAMQVGATLVSSLVIEKLGRKILLILSDLLMAVSIMLLGMYYTFKDNEVFDKQTIEDLGFLPVLALCIFIVVFSLGFGPIPWLMSSEVFPTEIKSTASSLAGAFNWFLAFLVTKFYVDLDNAIGGDVFYIFGGLSILGTIFVIFVTIETKGKTFDEIQAELSGRPIAKLKGVDNDGYQ